MKYLGSVKAKGNILTLKKLKQLWKKAKKVVGKEPNYYLKLIKK